MENQKFGNLYTQTAMATGSGGDEKDGIVEKERPVSVEETETTVFPTVYPRSKIYLISEKKLQDIIQALLRTMTLSEKCNLLFADTARAPKQTGFSSYLPGVPRLGVPEQRQHDGPAGVWYQKETTNLPVQLVAACSFNPDMAYAYGTVLGRELVSVGSTMMLGTQFDICRTPYFARGKDTFGEDYFLTGEMAVAETKGLQAQGAGAMAKHFGGYCLNGDAKVHVHIDEQTLHTVYYYPFEKACKEGNIVAVMSAYNRINGYWAASNAEMQVGVCRDMWNWKGCMTSDGGGNKELSLHLGTDVEMGNGLFHNEKNVRAYLRAGKISMDQVNNAVEHILYAYGSMGYLNLVEIDPDTGLAKYESGRKVPIVCEESYNEDRIAGLYRKNHQIAKEIALQGMVLLKNENAVLPLSVEELREKDGVALMGYGAEHYIGGTGMERAFGVLEYMKTAKEALEELGGIGTQIATYPVIDRYGENIPAHAVFQEPTCEQNGWVRSYGVVGENPGMNIERAFVRGPGIFGGNPVPGMDPQTEIPMGGFGGLPTGDPKVPQEHIVMPGHGLGEFAGIEGELDIAPGNGTFRYGWDRGIHFGDAYTWTGYIRPDLDGKYTLGLFQVGGSASCRVYHGEEEVLRFGMATPKDRTNTWVWDYWDQSGRGPCFSEVTFTQGEVYKVVVTGVACLEEKDFAIRLTWKKPGWEEKYLNEALDAAARYKKILYFVRSGLIGHFPVLQTHYDLSLPEQQEIRAIQKVAKEHGNQFILIVQNRTAFSTQGDWLEQTDALIASFYSGQAGMEALAELLTGQRNFGGKLCLTLPKKNEDTLITCSEDCKKRRGGGTGDVIYAEFDEGMDFGYRWNERMQIIPAFCFGFGLSYTKFDYRGVEAARTPEGVKVSLVVVNIGDVDGDEVVQVYLGEPIVPDYVYTAKKQLAAFSRVCGLRPGEERKVSLFIPERMLSYWDVKEELHVNSDGTKGKWKVAHGARKVLVGASSQDIRKEIKLDI